MADEGKLHERVMKLEMVFMHLEQTVSALDEVVRSQHKAIDFLEAKIAKLMRPAPSDDVPDFPRIDESADGE